MLHKLLTSGELRLLTLSFKDFGMKVLLNIVLTTVAVLIIAIVFPICLLVAIVKHLVGIAVCVKEPMLYNRYIEE